MNNIHLLILTRKSLIALATIFTLGGCATYHGAAEIVSVPAGAEVIDLKDNSVIGETPIVAHWEDSTRTRRYVALRLKKTGFKPEVSHFWVSMRHTSREKAEKEVKKVRVELEQR